MADVWVAAERKGTPYHRIDSTRGGYVRPLVLSPGHPHYPRIKADLLGHMQRRNVQ